VTGLPHDGPTASTGEVRPGSSPDLTSVGPSEEHPHLVDERVGAVPAMPATSPDAPRPGAGYAAAPGPRSARGLPRPWSRVLADRPWVGQTVLAAVVLLVGVATAVLARATVQGIVALGLFPEDTDRLTTVPVVWVLGAVVGATLLVVLRSRPLLAVGVLTVLAVLSLTTAGVLGVLGLCLALALCSVASSRPALVTWTACLAVVVVLTAAVWSWQVIGVAEMLLWGGYERPPGIEAFHQMSEPEFSSGRRSATVALLVVLLLLAVAVGASTRARHLKIQAETDRLEAAARDREASGALGRASERARIAREMHDIVAHSVSVMIALSDGASAAMDRAPESARVALGELSRTGRVALADLQRVLGAIDPDVSDGQGAAEVRAEPTEPTETELRTVVDRYRTAGLPLTATGLDVPLPEDTPLRLALVRIVAEALTNVLRYAPGTTAVEVVVRRHDGQVEVEILDAGSTDPGAGGGTGRGLVGMRERAALLGGHVDAGPRADGGWRVHVVLPAGVATETGTDVDPDTDVDLDPGAAPAPHAPGSPEDAR